MHLMQKDNNSLLFFGDALELINQLPDNIIQTCITSPTYWGKRQFTDDPLEFGKESIEEYVNRNVLLYDKILSKMKKTGSLFIVIQDSYMGSGISRAHHNHWNQNKNPEYVRDGLNALKQGNTSSVTARHRIIKNKSLCGLPYRIAIALVDKGYIWRQQIIWEKPNPMPENVKDRLRQSCEYILHFTKNRIYTFNEEYLMIKGTTGKPRMRNQVWVTPSEPRKGHTATFPTKIVERLLLATSNEEDVIFEPFLGSGTMYSLSKKNKRKFIGIDISLFLINDILARIKEDKEKELHNRSLASYLKRDPTQTSKKDQGTSISELINLKSLNLSDPEELKKIQDRETINSEEEKQTFFCSLVNKLIEHFEIYIRNYNYSFESNQDIKLKHDGKTYRFYGLLKVNDKRIAIEIPSIINFDTKRGAGAYYAAKRLREALEHNLIDAAILLLPQTAKKGKFTEIIENTNDRIYQLNLSQISANQIIENDPNLNPNLFDEMNKWLVEKVKQ